MINGSEILADLDKVKAKLKCNIDLFPNNDIWTKVYGEIVVAQETLRKDLKMFGYD